MKINGKIVKAEVVSTFCEETSQLLKAETFFAVESECQSPPYDLTPETQAKLDRLEEDVHYFHLRPRLQPSFPKERNGDGEEKHLQFRPIRH